MYHVREYTHPYVCVCVSVHWEVISGGFITLGTSFSTIINVQLIRRIKYRYKPIETVRLPYSKSPPCPLSFISKTYLLPLETISLTNSWSIILQQQQKEEPDKEKKKEKV